MGRGWFKSCRLYLDILIRFPAGIQQFSHLPVPVHKSFSAEPPMYVFTLKEVTEKNFRSLGELYKVKLSVKVWPFSLLHYNNTYLHYPNFPEMRWKTFKKWINICNIVLYELDHVYTVCTPASTWSLLLRTPCLHLERWSPVTCSGAALLALTLNCTVSFCPIFECISLVGGPKGFGGQGLGCFKKALW